MNKDSILSLREKQSDFESLNIDSDTRLRREQKMEDTQNAGVGIQKDSEISSNQVEQSTQVNLKEMLKDKRQNRRLSIKGQDLYTIMDLPKDSSEDEITSKYRSLAKMVHPGLVTIPNHILLLAFYIQGTDIFSPKGIIDLHPRQINDCFMKQAN